jgi:UDPglucose 6-dehydrogenase
VKICMIGSGYVGLVSGAGFSETGHDVICADIDASKIERLKRGEIPIFEPGLDSMVARNAAAGRLTFSNDVAGSIAQAQVVFCAVGTPMRQDGAADLSAVDAVALEVARSATRECVLVMKSTVPVGTNARVRRLVANATHTVHCVSNPEFLKEGDAIGDFMRPDRIVVGVHPDDAFSRDLMSRLYHPLNLDQDRIVWMDPASARAHEVRGEHDARDAHLVHERDRRCSARRWAPTCTTCARRGQRRAHRPEVPLRGPRLRRLVLPEGRLALIHTARDHGIELELAAATDQINRRHKGVLFRKLRALFGGDLRGKRIAIWGVAFKPRTDDLRESPALALIDSLLAEGAQVAAHDPEAHVNARALYGDRIELPSDPYAAADKADALVLVTEWRPYQNPDFDRLKSTMRRALLLDGRNIWSGYNLRKQGFTYDGIGVHGS